MSKRKELNAEFKELLGSNNVYFQPPSNIVMKYPCIIYEPGTPKTQRADDRNYVLRNRYTVTYISKNPDDVLPEKILEHFLFASIDRMYTADNLHHTVFEIYY